MKKGTKIIAIVLAVTLIAGLCIALTGCGKKDNKTEVIVFAAASMQETLTELGNTYMKNNPSIKLTFNFDSSGTLRTQIEEGAPCDIFISASPKHMNYLDKEVVHSDGKDKGLDLIDHATRFDFLENKVALCVPANNPKNINSWEDLKNAFSQDGFIFCMGNSDVPVGAYTTKILNFLELNEAELATAGKITYASNVKEVTSQITEGTVHCGVIYQTDAFSANLTPKALATADMCGQVIYPAALVKDSAHKTEAQAFIDFLRTPEADQVFTHVGFTPIHA